MITVFEFVLDDFVDLLWYEKPVKHTVEEIAPYFSTFVKDCHDWGREVPKELTPENYTVIWNALTERMM